MNFFQTISMPIALVRAFNNNSQFMKINKSPVFIKLSDMLITSKNKSNKFMQTRLKYCHAPE